LPAGTELVLGEGTENVLTASLDEGYGLMDQGALVISGKGMLVAIGKYVL
jgi:hypothetical protein